jgi:hypothetical protein
MNRRLTLIATTFLLVVGTQISAEVYAIPPFFFEEGSNRVLFCQFNNSQVFEVGKNLLADVPLGPYNLPSLFFTDDPLYNCCTYFCKPVAEDFIAGCYRAKDIPKLLLDFQEIPNVPDGILEKVACSFGSYRDMLAPDEPGTCWTSSVRYTCILLQHKQNPQQYAIGVKKKSCDDIEALVPAILCVKPASKRTWNRSSGVRNIALLMMPMALVSGIVFSGLIRDPEINSHVCFAASAITGIALLVFDVHRETWPEYKDVLSR